MNNRKKGDGKQPQPTAASNSFGDLVQRALAQSPDAKKAYDQLRTTYLKEVGFKDKPKKQYWKIFPESVLRVHQKLRAHPGERERLHDFFFSINAEAVCFVRNLWFAHQFFSKPSEVEQFLTTASTQERREKFERRSEELEALASTYAGWLKAAGGISRKLENFKSTKTDLLAASEDTADLPEATRTFPTPPGSAAVADLIREVEQRASYQAGNPDDACEKALYFLALGRPGIGETIAREVLAENPGHAVALYANAVLLLDAGERHRQQAFVHDVMHPHDLPPLDAEEFHHADRHVEESLQASEKETKAFLLMLKARQNWPKKFAIKCYDLSPSVWQHKVDEWLFRQAAVRVREDPKELRLPSSTDAKSASKMLAQIVSDIWANGGRWMFNPISSTFLRCFIIVAFRVQIDVARDCVKKLEAALDQLKLDEMELLWRDAGMVLPVSHEPTLAETLIPAARDSLFSCVIFATRPVGDAAALLRRIAQTGLADEHDRRTVLRSLAMREVVLNVVHGGASAQAVELCREMAERRDWPATATGEKMQACWQYAVIVLLFESSRAAFEANNIQAAAERIALALQHATDSLEAIAGEKPLLKFIESDEYDDREIVGDFLHRRPNIVTDTRASDFFRPPAPWEQANPLHVHHMACWDDFVKWSEGECPPGTPLLLAYGYWLARQHGQGDMLLPRCDALAARIRPCPK
ncbi:MAG: hypothetical protein L0Y58_18550 [Verrucomicrobia subdivision 3 bacterium]|nr:hypothetical protein [Limisphaerales bacterium]